MIYDISKIFCLIKLQVFLKVTGAAGTVVESEEETPDGMNFFR